MPVQVLFVFAAIFFFFFFLPGLFTLRPREEAIVLRWGKFIEVIRGEGVRWSQPIGRTTMKISTQDETFEVHKTTVVEANGNPIEISAVVTYRVEDCRKAALDVSNYQSFVRDQATAVVKRVAAHFPYDSPSLDIPCLRKESPEVGSALISELQNAVHATGVRILSVRINDLAYSPEIAQSMLMRQQAQAMIDARRAIVDGAVDIVQESILRLQKTGIRLSAEKQEELIANLLIVLCSNHQTTQTIAVGTRNKQG